MSLTPRLSEVRIPDVPVTHGKWEFAVTRLVAMTDPQELSAVPSHTKLQ